MLRASNGAQLFIRQITNFAGVASAAQVTTLTSCHTSDRHFGSLQIKEHANFLEVARMGSVPQMQLVIWPLTKLDSPATQATAQAASVCAKSLDRMPFHLSVHAEFLFSAIPLGQSELDEFSTKYDQALIRPVPIKGARRCDAVYCQFVDESGPFAQGPGRPYLVPVPNIPKP